MAYCRKCGTPIDDNAINCPHCGESQGVRQSQPPVVDNGGFGWGLLGFCIPIVGLVLFLVWKDSKPITAKAAGWGALIYVIAIVAIYVFALIFGVAGALL